MHSQLYFSEVIPCGPESASRSHRALLTPKLRLLFQLARPRESACGPGTRAITSANEPVVSPAWAAALAFCQMVALIAASKTFLRKVTVQGQSMPSGDQREDFSYKTPLTTLKV